MKLIYVNDNLDVVMNSVSDQVDTYANLVCLLEYTVCFTVIFNSVSLNYRDTLLTL